MEFRITFSFVKAYAVLNVVPIKIVICYYRIEYEYFSKIIFSKIKAEGTVI